MHYTWKNTLENNHGLCILTFLYDTYLVLYTLLIYQVFSFSKRDSIPSVICWTWCYGVGIDVKEGQNDQFLLWH